MAPTPASEQSVQAAPTMRKKMQKPIKSKTNEIKNNFVKDEYVVKLSSDPAKIEIIRTLHARVNLIKFK
jgi:hypothetical protein